jgi:ribosomal protein S18 acetylase RimI-like enzyme
VVRITSLGFRTDVALRVLEGAEVTDRGDYLVIRTPDNPEFWWGNFLLLARLPGPGQGQEWLDTFAAEFPAARHVALGVDIADDSEIPGAFAAAGLEADRATVLTAAEVRAPAQPNSDAEIRPLTSDADWRQSVDLANRCFPGGEPGDFLERRAAARRRLTQTGAGVWFGAFGDGRLLAQLGLFDVGDGYARYQHVETDPAARRHGLAGTLIWTAGRYGRAVLRTGTLVIVADPAGAAIRLYRACGFTARQSQLSFDRPPGPSA